MTSECRCSDFQDKCPDGHRCDALNHVCTCGNASASSCESFEQAPFCDSLTSTCKCSAQVDACHHSETCYEGVCKCGNGTSCDKNPSGDICDPLDKVCKCFGSTGVYQSCEEGQICKPADSSQPGCCNILLKF